MFSVFNFSKYNPIGYGVLKSSLQQLDRGDPVATALRI